jgi:membrane protein
LAGPGSLLSRTVRSARRDRVSGTSAELAFFLLLSIPPAILILAGLAGYVGDLLGANVQRSMQSAIIEGLGRFLQPDTMNDFVVPAVSDLFARGRADILSVGAVLAVWSVSRVTAIFMQASDVAFGRTDVRARWRHRLAALGITFGGLVVAAFALPIIVAGPRLGRAIAEHTPLPSGFEDVWRVVYWPFAAVTGVALLAWMFHVASGRGSRWRSHLPGAALAAGVWIVAAGGLRIYADAALGKGSAFGPLGAPIILLLWLYLSAVALLIGVELNAELSRGENHSERGSDPVTGER